MAVRWNSECFTAMEYRDLQANAMAVDNTGTYVLLAGRRYIALRNLDDLDANNIKKFPRQSKYDVGAAEWNPNPNNSELCVISSNQRLEVLTWKVELIQTQSLRAHTRVITDLNWHQTDPNLLASCSVDTFIHIWDLRDPRRPSLSLSAVAEASQVRWNRISSNVLATAHDGDIKLWDQRKGTAPIQYIAAHLAKIHGLDWNPHSDTQLATSSQDNTVKFFDINNPKRPEHVITTNAPVWRARHTPFGNGLITVVVPQLRRGENSLLLWNTANKAAPVHTFVGHRDVVLEFEWRKPRPGDADFQLVTWSKDQTLLVWKIEPYLQKLCGYEPEEQDDELSAVESVAHKNNSNKKTSPKVQPLHQEFSLLNVHIPNLEVLKMDPEQRNCSVRVTRNSTVAVVLVTFPNAYPHGIAPNFQIISGSTVEEAVAAQLLQTLTHIAQQRVSKNRTCLESCLRQLVTTLDQLVKDSSSSTDKTDGNSFVDASAAQLHSFDDAYIPFPRSAGAKFCSVSTLVCFGRPKHSRRLTTNSADAKTPRALSALEKLHKHPNEFMTVSTFYFQKQRTRSKHAAQGKSGAKSVVHVYDASGLFLMNRQLAEEYILDGDVGTICKYNAAAAAVVFRSDLVQAWTLAELVSSPQQAEEENMWSMHPFGSQLMQSLISHYASQSDIQTAAMLSCIFGKEQDNPSLRRSNSRPFSSAPFKPGKWWLKSGGSPYHTIPPADVVAEGWVFPLIRATRSSSLDNLPLEETARTPPQKSPTTTTTTYSLYEYYKLAYAETLHRWGLLYKRAEVLKYMCKPAEVHKGVEFVTDCQYCAKSAKSCSCVHCKRLALNCVICHISVRGSANCCLVCGHGGHTAHLQQWFAQNDVCASGCGCHCAIETASMFTYE